MQQSANRQSFGNSDSLRANLLKLRDSLTILVANTRSCREVLFSFFLNDFQRGYQ